MPNSLDGDVRSGGFRPIWVVFDVRFAARHTEMRSRAQAFAFLAPSCSKIAALYHELFSAGEMFVEVTRTNQPARLLHKVLLLAASAVALPLNS